MNAHAETAGTGRAGGAIVVRGSRPIVVEGTLIDVDGLAIGATPGAIASRGQAFRPREDVRVRAGTLDDLPFIDGLQKAQSRAVGFLPTMAIEGKIRLGEVLIAEVEANVDCGLSNVEKSAVPSSQQSTFNNRPSPTPVGYLIASDRYFKRDEVGYVTQMNVSLNYRRSLVAATLLQAQFDRSAYGCRLYSCWCAQDLKANEFWEAMGFTAIAFRTGSRTKGKNGSPRIHLFWQKRIRADDRSTPWWYPAQTGGGALREDRLVFPIPPGTHWRDVLPVVLPTRGQEAGGEGQVKTLAEAEPAPQGELSPGEKRWAKIQQVAAAKATRGALPGPRPPTELELKLADADARGEAREAIRTRMRLHPPVVPTKPLGLIGAIWHIPDYDDYQPTEAEIDAEIVDSLSVERKRLEAKRAKARAKKEAAKVEPALTAFAREMRDRWLESADAIVANAGKYDVVRRIEATPTATISGPTTPALPVAA